MFMVMMKQKMFSVTAAFSILRWSCRILSDQVRDPASKPKVHADRWTYHQATADRQPAEGHNSIKPGPVYLPKDIGATIRFPIWCNVTNLSEVNILLSVQV